MRGAAIPHGDVAEGVERSDREAARGSRDLLIGEAAELEPAGSGCIHQCGLRAAGHSVSHGELLASGGLERDREGVNARIGEMGGDQAANVLATVRRDGIEAKGGNWSADEEEAFKAPIRAQYEVQGHPYYATARLWDDGLVDPAQARRVLGLSLAASLNAPIPPTKFGIFRM